VELTEQDVLAVVSERPCKVGELGLLVLAAHGVRTVPDAGQPIGAFLAAEGLSLSALQKVVDALVAAGRVRELRGRELWDSFQQGLGANAKGRHFVSA
jgi:hypothetical protein